MKVTTGQIVSTRRVRLFFDATLGAGAFTTTALYRAECVNEVGESPSVAAVQAVAGSPAALELQFGTDLVAGGIYKVFAESVPDSIGNLTAAGSHVTVAPGGKPAQPILPVGDIEDADAWIYGIDIIHDGTDWLLDASGDLAQRTGAPLARVDLQNRLLSDGLPWDDAYGVKSREYIDGTPGAALALRGTSISQMLEDDRVTSCDAIFGEDEGTGDAYIEVRPVLIGDAARSGIEPMRQSLTQTNT